jgi:hypothetical protein
MKGYHALQVAVYKVERPLRAALDDMEFDMFDHISTLVLATIPTCILREVIACNLAHAHLGEKKPDNRERRKRIQ